MGEVEPQVDSASSRGGDVTAVPLARGRGLTLRALAARVALRAADETAAISFAPTPEPGVESVARCSEDAQ